MADNKVKVKPAAFFIQVAATLAIASLPALQGLVFAWPSYTVANFGSNETVLSRPMSSLEISMLGSLPNIGALIATPFCGYIVNTIGRKYSAMLFGLPFILGWTIISITSCVPFVIIAVSLGGIGAAGQAVSLVFISEISQDSIRGGLSSAPVAGYFVGLLISYVLGGYLSYQLVICANLAISILYVVLIALLKESPVFLLLQGNDQAAASSLAFYRQMDSKSKEIKNELEKLKLQFDPRFETLQEANEDPLVTKELLKSDTDKVNKAKTKSNSAWKFLLESQSSKRALFASLFLMVSNTLMGAIVLQVYAEPLFKEAVPSMPSNLCSIFLALDFMLSVFSCALIVDRFGRKFLMTTTSVASGVCTLLIAVQVQYQIAPHWVTAFLIYAFCYINYLGAATVPFIFMAEVFLPEVRGLGNSITLASLWFTNFLCLIVFNPLVDSFGLGPLFYGFTVVCFIAALYSHYCLPETKGLSADVIQTLFLKKQVVHVHA